MVFTCLYLRGGKLTGRGGVGWGELPDDSCHVGTQGIQSPGGLECPMVAHVSPGTVNAASS